MCRNKCNWDEVLAYPTIKVIKVRDRYLGTIRLLLLLSIFAYIIGYVIVWNRAYLQCLTPNGAVEVSLKRPGGRIDPSVLHYCTQYTNVSGQPVNIQPALPCKVVDSGDAYVPVDQTAAMFITTRFSNQEEVANADCLALHGCTDPWISVNGSNYTNAKFYSAAIDEFTIKMSHFFQAREFYLETHDKFYSQSCSQMKGKLVNRNGKTLKHYGNDATDIIPLSLLLKGVHVDLNTVTDNPVDRRSNESFRSAGIVLLLGISYSNEFQSDVEYTYQVTRVPEVEYKVTSTQIIGEKKRLTTDRHGVKIFFIFSGNICRFDFQTMLIQLVAGLGLLSIATVATDFMMSYVMPLRVAYNSFKYSATESHKDIESEMKRYGKTAFSSRKLLIDNVNADESGSVNNKEIENIPTSDYQENAV